MNKAKYKKLQKQNFNRIFKNKSTAFHDEQEDITVRNQIDISKIIEESEQNYSLTFRQDSQEDE